MDEPVRQPAPYSCARMGRSSRAIGLSNWRWVATACADQVVPGDRHERQSLWKIDLCSTVTASASRDPHSRFSGATYNYALLSTTTSARPSKSHSE